MRTLVPEQATQQTSFQAAETHPHPAEAITAHDIITNIPPPKQTLTELEEYIQEQHFQDIGKTTTDLDWLAVSKFTGASVLTNDELLQHELGLPPEIKAVQSQMGVIHTSFDPTMVVPAFHSTKEAIPIPVN